MEQEIREFLAASPTTEQIIAFQPSPKARERGQYLIEMQRYDSLTPRERAELEDHRRLTQYVAQLKLQAGRKASAS
jgi:hypothetical protein